MADASTPILFTLPSVNVSGGGQAVCSFFDPAAGAYATHGCIGVPSPAPPGHTLAFVNGFTAAGDANLSMAWSISGPLVSGCSVTVLDCNTSTPTPAAGVACPAAGSGSGGQQPVLRVYSGAQCTLVQPNNTYGCSWSNLMQAFVGSGCVAASGPTQCMCRHVRAPAALLRAHVHMCDDQACM